MKKLSILVIVCGTLSMTVNAQSSDDKYLIKVQTLDGTIETLYGVISGEKDVERDWELFKYLFHPDAKLIPTGKNQAGVIGATFMTPEDYIARAGKMLVEIGFFEKEIHRTEDTFGNITEVFSTYNSYNNESMDTPFARGINSIQLLNDGNRWWIINIYWMQESEENPIPEKYLPKN
ncbi:hypothetical protein [Algoriphagus antarcticus]|uniref:SnoaL-like protein n=1 Tax=Algoriphagus antarcticus TaxID=238540 RepID=A0A3E0DKH8_9BACT|nr:hypothetical protein [Algoriphagus antarcticus]REG83133.1 hypothetical protein C8N25_11997 [Algoriphagus antarcticus]